jgi:hypothetical protein
VLVQKVKMMQKPLIMLLIQQIKSTSICLNDAKSLFLKMNPRKIFSAKP